MKLELISVTGSLSDFYNCTFSSFGRNEGPFSCSKGRRGVNKCEEGLPNTKWPGWLDTHYIGIRCILPLNIWGGISPLSQSELTLLWKEALHQNPRKASLRCNLHPKKWSDHQPNSRWLEIHRNSWAKDGKKFTFDFVEPLRNAMKAGRNCPPVLGAHGPFIMHSFIQEIGTIVPPVLTRKNQKVSISKRMERKGKSGGIGGFFSPFLLLRWKLFSLKAERSPHTRTHAHARTLWSLFCQPIMTISDRKKALKPLQSDPFWSHLFLMCGFYIGERNKGSLLFRGTSIYWNGHF